MKNEFVLNIENQYNRLFCNSRLTFTAVDFSTAVLIKTTINVCDFYLETQAVLSKFPSDISVDTNIIRSNFAKQSCLFG